MNRLLLRLNYPCIFNILLSASNDYQILRVTAVNLADWGIILLVIVNIVALLKSLSFLGRGAALILSKHKIIPYFIILLIFSKIVLGGVGWYHMTYLFGRSSVRSVIGFILFLIIYFSINVIRCFIILIFVIKRNSIRIDIWMMQIFPWSDSLYRHRLGHYIKILFLCRTFYVCILRWQQRI